jgi:hypothetical protein
MRGVEEPRSRRVVPRQNSDLPSIQTIKLNNPIGLILRKTGPDAVPAEATR